MQKCTLNRASFISIEIHNYFGTGSVYETKFAQFLTENSRFRYPCGNRYCISMQANLENPLVYAKSARFFLAIL